MATNPFYVLGLRPDCARAEIEREGQKLLGMLELEMGAASHYRSPLGEHRRTPSQIREAMAELRDPDRRLLHELWATLDPYAESSREHAPPGADRHGRSDPNGRESGEPGSGSEAGADLSPFRALSVLGFRSRRGKE